MTTIRRTIAAVAASLTASLALAGAVAAGELPELAQNEAVHVRGWLELARVEPADLLMRAKLDSGALTSALHAEILRGPEGRGFPEDLDDDVEIDYPAEGVDDDDAIVFAVESRRGRRVVFEREIVRWVRVKDRDGGSHTRPVVRMDFCIGGVPVEGDVGLTDRADFNYPLLIGRRMLTAAKIQVSAWETFTHESRCYEDGARVNES